MWRSQSVFLSTENLRFLYISLIVQGLLAWKAPSGFFKYLWFRLSGVYPILVFRDRFQILFLKVRREIYFSVVVSQAWFIICRYLVTSCLVAPSDIWCVFFLYCSLISLLLSFCNAEKLLNMSMIPLARLVPLQLWWDQFDRHKNKYYVYFFFFT